MSLERSAILMSKINQAYVSLDEVFISTDKILNILRTMESEGEIVLQRMRE